MPLGPTAEVGNVAARAVLIVVSSFVHPHGGYSDGTTPDIDACMNNRGGGLCCMCCSQPVLTAVMAIVLTASRPLLMPLGPVAEMGNVAAHCCIGCSQFVRYYSCCSEGITPGIHACMNRCRGGLCCLCCSQPVVTAVLAVCFDGIIPDIDACGNKTVEVGCVVYAVVCQFLQPLWLFVLMASSSTLMHVGTIVEMGCVVCVVVNLFLQPLWLLF